MSSLFTIAGGVAGFLVGGPAGASAGASIGAGIDGYNTSRDQADEISRTGAYNSQNAIAMANYNAASVRNAAKIQAGLGALGAAMDAHSIQAVASLNAYFQREMGHYNATLLREEAQVLLEALELDIHQVEKQYSKILGTAEVGFASSGVRIDVEGDSSSLVLLDIATEREMEIMIMTKNGQEEARKILNAAARSEFEGNVSAAQILFEGQQRSSSVMFSSALRETSLFMNAETQARGIEYEGSVASGQHLYNASRSARSTRLAGDRALVSGLVSGATQAYAAYDPRRRRTGGTTQSGAGGEFPNG